MRRNGGDVNGMSLSAVLRASRRQTVLRVRGLAKRRVRSLLVNRQSHPHLIPRYRAGGTCPCQKTSGMSGMACPLSLRMYLYESH